MEDSPSTEKEKSVIAPKGVAVLTSSNSAIIAIAINLVKIITLIGALAGGLTVILCVLILRLCINV
jgi:uncharacterized membrane protein